MNNQDISKDVTKNYTKNAGVTIERQPRRETNVLTALKQRADSSPVFNAMAHAFAVRQRTRSQIVIHTWLHKMQKEGYNFTKNQYVEQLRFMADLGLGKLYLDSKGRVSALKDIKTTLQSIGLAALSKTVELKKFHAAKKFRDLIPPKPDFNTIRKPLPELLEIKEEARPSAPVTKPADLQAHLTVMIEGKRIELDLFPAITVTELLVLIAKASANSAKKGAL